MLSRYTTKWQRRRARVAVRTDKRERALKKALPRLNGRRGEGGVEAR